MIRVQHQSPNQLPQSGRFGISQPIGNYFLLLRSSGSLCPDPLVPSLLLYLVSIPEKKVPVASTSSWVAVDFQLRGNTSCTSITISHLNSSWFFSLRLDHYFSPLLTSLWPLPKNCYRRWFNFYPALEDCTLVLFCFVNKNESTTITTNSTL